MDSSRPEPPGDLPDHLVQEIEDSSTETLRSLSRFAEDLANYRDEYDGSEENLEGNGEQQLEKNDDTDQDDDTDQNDDTDQDDDGPAQDSPDDRPDGVPSKASVTTKEINGNRYHYWQWRDGDTIRSKYKGPANSSDSR